MRAQQAINKWCKDTMVQFKPTFKPALLISSPAACTIFFDDMTRPWLLKNGIWYSRVERFPLFVLDGRIWYVSLNKVCYDVRGWERREDLLPYKVAKWPIFCLNRVDFWRLDPQRTSAGRQPNPPERYCMYVYAWRSSFIGGWWKWIFQCCCPLLK